MRSLYPLTPAFALRAARYRGADLFLGQLCRNCNPAGDGSSGVCIRADLLDESAGLVAPPRVLGMCRSGTNAPRLRWDAKRDRRCFAEFRRTALCHEQTVI